MRGQISLDLLITLVVVIIAIGGFFFLIHNYQDSYESILTENQLHLLASNYTSIITSSHVLDDYNFTARIIPRQVTFGNTKEYPNISISDNNLIVEINGFEKKGTSNFGTGLDVEIENGIVVIKNAP